MNVGEYVRNENGLIGKIIGFKGDMVETDNKRLITYKSNHSECKIKENIIDLIEVGDIVNYEQLNGGVVLNKKDDSIDTWSILPNSLKNEDIKSAITKEQLKNCMYEVGD